MGDAAGLFAYTGDQGGALTGFTEKRKITAAKKQD
jgi:hypothetical protein